MYLTVWSWSTLQRSWFFNPFDQVIARSSLNKILWCYHLIMQNLFGRAFLKCYLYFLGFFKKKFDFWGRLLEVTNHLFFFVLFFLLSLEIWINKLTKFASHDHTPNLSTGANGSVTVNGRSGSLQLVKHGIISILVTLNTVLLCDWRSTM